MVIFRKINSNEELQFMNCCFLADSVLKLNTEIDKSNRIRTHNHLVRKRTLNHLIKLVINNLNSAKTEFLNFSIESPIQYCPEKENFVHNFCS